MSAPLDIAVIGGGAAGFFAAITAAETRPGQRITIFEKGPRPLSKVRISGGGRCNVTHACFEPRELVRFYPRGARELRGPFHTFGPRETVDWFAAQGVRLKTEADGRMFPTTDQSATVIAALEKAARQGGVRLETKAGITALQPEDDGTFHLTHENGDMLRAHRVMVAVGGLKHAGMATELKRLGHQIVPLAPSLFTFKIEDRRLRDLSGVSVPEATVSVPEVKKLTQTGPLLITHWGLSGPATLKTSAVGARALQDLGYRFTAVVNWTGQTKTEAVLEQLRAEKQAHGKRMVARHPLFGLSTRLWERLTQAADIPDGQIWSVTTKGQITALATQLTAARFAVTGKSMNKDEFVTSGGVSLKEVDFKTMESRRVPGLHFGGEVLDIDALTGGFNFQAAWTTGFLAGTAMAAAPSSDAKTGS